MAITRNVCAVCARHDRAQAILPAVVNGARRSLGSEVEIGGLAAGHETPPEDSDDGSRLLP